MESAVQSMQELKTTKTVSPPSSSPTQHVVQRMSSAKGSESGAVSKGPVCYRCGFRGHIAAKCTVDARVKCFECNERGHLRRACKLVKRRGTPRSRTSGGKSRNVCRVEEDDSDEAGACLCHVKSCGVSHTPPIQVQVRLDDCLVAMEVDTGASVTPRAYRAAEGGERAWK